MRGRHDETSGSKSRHCSTDVARYLGLGAEAQSVRVNTKGTMISRGFVHPENVEFPSKNCTLRCILTHSLKQFVIQPNIHYGLNFL